MHRRVSETLSWAGALASLLTLLTASACGESSTAPTPLPTPPSVPGVLAGARSGPVEIEYVAASVEPGSTIAGCGQQLGACLDRLSVTFRLRATTAAPVIRADASLHAINNLACLSAASEAFEIQASVPHTLTLTYDRFDPACPVPVDIRHMALTLTGPSQTDSRQEWSVMYTFAP